jgi:hypothetical protein
MLGLGLREQSSGRSRVTPGEPAWLAAFPADFLFQLSKSEMENLRSQFVISSWGGQRHPPYAFTEHGVSMLKLEREYDSKFKRLGSVWTDASDPT